MPQPKKSKVSDMMNRTESFTESAPEGMPMMARMPDMLRRMMSSTYQRDVDLPMEDGDRRDSRLPMTPEMEREMVHSALREAMGGAKVVKKLAR